MPDFKQALHRKPVLELRKIQSFLEKSTPKSKIEPQQKLRFKQPLQDSVIK